MPDLSNEITDLADGTPLYHLLEMDSARQKYICSSNKLRILSAL